MQREQRVQYIYGYEELTIAPDNPTSARVAPRRILSGDTFETAKSSTIGAVLYGEHVAVALAMRDRPPARALRKHSSPTTSQLSL